LSFAFIYLDKKDWEIGDKFICNGTEKVMDRYLVCDGDNDFGNNADEENCFKNSILYTKDKFVCEGSERCISELLVCDGKNDCDSGEDAKYCYPSISTKKSISISISSFAEVELIEPSLPDLKHNERGCPPDKFLCHGLNTTLIRNVFTKSLYATVRKVVEPKQMSKHAQ